MITNVNYEATLDSNSSMKTVTHQNHLVEYYPAEETIP